MPSMFWIVAGVGVLMIFGVALGFVEIVRNRKHPSVPTNFRGNPIDLPIRTVPARLDLDQRA